MDNFVTSFFTLAGKISATSLLSSLLCILCGRPLIEPRQVSCGDRICSRCHSSLLASSTKTFRCKRCNLEVDTDECFRDRAVEQDLRRARFPCSYPGCPWLGSHLEYREHEGNCDYAPICCPNHGCAFKGHRMSLENHLATCPAQQIKCQWCEKVVSKNTEEEHIAVECSGAMINCTAGCEMKVTRKELPSHLQNDCPKQKRPCPFTQFGCTFLGDAEKNSAHVEESVSYHLKLLLDHIQTRSKERSDQDLSVSLFDLQQKKKATEKQLVVVHGELARIAEETNLQIAPLREALGKLESNFGDFRESFSELVLMVQTLQATSYDGEFIWKIPEVARRLKEARIGKTISLYSAPFFTSRFGYKMCLRLYLNGDGSGKGTHLSYFLTIMKGEYDALLRWPFQQMVTLILLDQDKKNHIIQRFRPEPSSSSFWKPEGEMNVASGCPKFAPLSVLDHPSYVKNNTLFLKILVDKTGLTEP